MSADTALKNGLRAFQQGLLSEAESELKKAIAIDPNLIEARHNLGLLLSKMLRMDDAEPHLRWVCDALPDSAEAHHAYGVALSVLGRREEAETALRKAIQLRPDFAAAREDLADLASPSTQTRIDKQTLKRWPILMTELQDLYESAQRYVIDSALEPPFRIDEKTRFFTFGSCFAANLASSLKSMNRAVEFFPYSEEINSTYANRYLIEWATSRLEAPELRAYFDKEFSNIRPKQFASVLSKVDVIIFTVGVAPCFFERETGRFVLPRASNVSLWAQDNVFRTTSVRENRENLLSIIERVRELNPTANIVLTVSPVPLKATLEMGSIVQADAVSKSILRVAVHEVMEQKKQGVSYWPSYEIVRWLGIFFEQTFGADDGRSRHVSKHVIDINVQLFLEHHR